jgi:uncharacterized OB-fold protein
VQPFIPPELTVDSEPFWRGGAAGRLLITRCRVCGLYLHPPRPACRRCRAMDVEPVEVSGRGVVHTFTVAHHAFIPGVEVPYVIAVVELVEQPGLRLLSNVIDCDPETVAIGMPVQAVFTPMTGVEGIAVPQFVPDTLSAPAA